MRQKRTTRTLAGALVLFGALCNTGKAHTQAAPPASAPPASAAASASVALPPLDLASGKIVPFRYNPPTMPFLVVQARVNGQGPYPFMVDTGVSNPLLIAKDFVPRLKLRANGHRSKANGTVNVTGVSVQSLQLSTARPDDTLLFTLTDAATTAYVVDLAFLRDVYEGPPLAGVIGAPVLAAMTERIDFTRHEMTFYPQPHAPLQLPSATRLPVRGKDARYFVEVGAQDAATTPLLLDTGALLTTLPVSFRPHLHPTATILDGHATVGSYTIGSRWLLPALRLGALEEPEIAASVGEEGDGVLGLNVLTRFVLYLDLRNQEMLVQRASDYAARRVQQGWTGIHLADDDLVDKLRPATPAYRAGVRTGDKLLTLDGTKIAGVSAYLLLKLLDGTAGTPLTLTLSRGSASAQTVVVPRASEFDASPSALDGVLLFKADKPYMAVQHVAAGSLADKAGLRTGDRIVRLNGKAAKTLTWEDMWEEVQTSPIQMQVTDAQGKHPHDVLLALPPVAP